jgi:hypothetical protein
MLAFLSLTQVMENERAHELIVVRNALKSIVYRGRPENGDYVSMST